MGHLVTSAENCRPSEGDVCDARLKLLAYILRAGEPYKVGNSRPVGEVGDEPFAPRPHVKLLETQYLTSYLDERHVASYLLDGVYPAAVYILVRIVFKQVAERVKSQFATQESLSVRPDARQVLYVLV